jgi:hypothetical protein
MSKTYIFINGKTNAEKVVKAINEREARQKLLVKLPDKGTIDNWELRAVQVKHYYTKRGTV